MMAYKTILALVIAQVATAHFGVNYPDWRADTLASEDNPEISQWIYPCAGVEYGAGNITDWPLDGGSVSLQLNHPWSYVYINLGIGNGTDDFSTVLTPSLHNATSNGTLCIEKLSVPASDEIKNGTLATLQIITGGESGSALYNCADIRFSSTAKTLSGCKDDNEVELLVVEGDAGEAAEHDHGDSADESGGDESNEDTQSGDEDGAAGMLGVNSLALAAIVGMTMALSVGL